MDKLDKAELRLDGLCRAIINRITYGTVEKEAEVLTRFVNEARNTADTIERLVKEALAE